MKTRFKTFARMLLVIMTAILLLLLILICTGMRTRNQAVNDIITTQRAAMTATLRAMD